jgi:hypothetical protein
MKKVNAVRPKNENNFLRLLLSLKLAEYKIAAESFSEIVFFLVQYSFLFEDTEKVLNSCGTEQSQLYALQENRDLGARYLDPRYSVWKSADPALGDYLPVAPVNDDAKKHNQSLPGNGGVFNVVNLNLYHYAGNNPIKYVDPDGRKDKDFYLNMFDMMQNGCTQGEVFNESMNYCEQQFAAGFSIIQQDVAKGIIGGMKFISDYGAEISLVCYASGQVELGIGVDLLTATCDITLAYSDYIETGDSKKYTKDIGKIILSTLTAVGIGKGVSSVFKSGLKLTNADYEKIIDVSANLETYIMTKSADNVIDEALDE